ncbi:MAG: N-acetylmuramoyl-L-alanine amidase [Clostridium sp.]|nr:N-acetylmuramoyl-L-alanine amidase [Clostridium sp.]
MIRKKLIRLIKKITVSLVLVFTLATPFYTLKAYVPEQYVLKESSINYNTSTKKILLDLAHHDTINDKGCSFGEYNEREISENISLKVKEILENKGITVELTRGKEDVISIADRIVLANSNEYDYYISIHVNSTEIENKGTGIEAFSCDCWSLSHKVLEKLEKEFNYQNRGIYESDFYNKRIDSKSTIIEIGFLNNEYDRNNLINHQDKYAECIANGIYEQLMRE